jgi:environmental stress-induced protein Ves
MRRITSNEFKTMPWKNGNGITTEIFRFPLDGEFKLRISVATVSEDGWFSIYPSVDRQLMVLLGEGVELTLPTEKVILTPDSDPLSFNGEDEIKCELIDGPITDFNVMIERGWGAARLGWSTNPEGVVSDDLLFLYKDDLLLQYEPGESYSEEGKYLEIKIKRAPEAPRFI